MRIVLVTKLMSLSLLIAVATGATAVAQESGAGSTSSSGSVHTHHIVYPTPMTPSSTEAATATTSTTTTENSTTTTTAASGKESHQARLSAVKMRVCQNRQKGISNIMSRISDRGQKQLNLFTAIATKTEAFYASKGKTVANYDALVAAVNDKKAAAQTTVSTIKTDSANFSCSSSDPQGSIATFKTALKSEIQALKDYRTAVKNLIVGVKSAQTSAAEDN